jgi:hypothetical protein
LGLGRAPGSDQITARAVRRALLGSEDSFSQEVVELMGYFEPVEPGQRVQAVPGAGLKVPIWIPPVQVPIVSSSLASASPAARRSWFSIASRSRAFKAGVVVVASMSLRRAASRSLYLRNSGRLIIVVEIPSGTGRDCCNTIPPGMARDEVKRRGPIPV